MLPGPTYIYECPNCGNLLSNESLMSGNTFDSKLFSDGKTIAPMLPEFPDLTKCKKCNTIFWLSKLKEIGTYDYNDDENLTCGKADRADFLTVDDYHNAIKKGLAGDIEEEVIIRQQLWWAYNDRIREGQNIFTNEEDEARWKDNIINLKKILDQLDINHKIMVAEIHRNLGEFEECFKLIESIDTNELDWLKVIFLNECKTSNRWVVELNTDL